MAGKTRLQRMCPRANKVAPPLMVSDHQVDRFIEATHSVVELAHSPTVFGSEALGLARRVAGV